MPGLTGRFLLLAVTRGRNLNGAKRRPAIGGIPPPLQEEKVGEIRLFCFKEVKECCFGFCADLSAMFSAEGAPRYKQKILPGVTGRFLLFAVTRGRSSNGT